MKNEFKELSIEVTDKCSLNCIYCSSKAGINRNKHIDYIKIKKIISDAKNNFGIKIVSLSGGETFLYPNFMKLFNFIADNDLDIIIYTSGILLSENKRVPISSDILKKMKNKKNSFQIKMNIQGHNKKLTEQINRTKGSFEIIEKSINNIVNEDICLGAHVVPFKNNYKHLIEITEYCKEKSFKEINFLRFVPQGRGNNKNMYNSRKEFHSVISTIAKILDINKKVSDFKIRIGHPINFLFLIDKDYLYQNEKKHYCRGGEDAPLILPDGTVCMCPAWKDLKQFSAGNIYNNTFSEIWESEYFKICRDFIKKGYNGLKEPCNGCKYLINCRGKCIAQRLLTIKNKKNLSLEDIIFNAPDPQCFKSMICK
jgi:radical SAM protein with 4Fe4S-binding SPASM domain